MGQKCLTLMQFVSQKIYFENSLDFYIIKRNILFRIYVDSFAVLTLQMTTRLLLQPVHIQ